MKRMDHRVVDKLLRQQQERKQAWEAICDGEHEFTNQDILSYPDGWIGQTCQRCRTLVVYQP